MSILTLHPEADPQTVTIIRNPEEIATELAKVDILFERWTTEREFNPLADEAEILEAYSNSISRLVDRYEFRSRDVISLRPDHPQKKALRNKFLSEHTHSEFEVRFFVEGQGLFYLHPDNRVFIVLCKQGDLISIPAGTRHWFDMGDSPSFRCIRLFTNPEGWVAEYTGDPIADRFPRLESYLEQYA